MNKLLFWGFVFSVFGVYATGVLTHAYQGQVVEAAYAAEIKKDIKSSDDGNVYVIATPYRNPFIRILERLNLRAQKERELCEVSETAFSDLRKSHEFTVEEKDIDGKKVRIATPTSALFSDDLKKINIHCKKLEILERLILLFSGKVS